MFKKFLTLSLSTSILALGLTACGSTTEDRAISGGLIGAGVGAAGAAATGQNVLGGAAIGAGVGATAGAVTDEDDVDLGKPVWKK